MVVVVLTGIAGTDQGTYKDNKVRRESSQAEVAPALGTWETGVHRASSTCTHV